MYEIKDLLTFKTGEQYKESVVLDSKAFVITNQRIIEISRKDDSAKSAEVRK